MKRMIGFVLIFSLLCSALFVSALSPGELRVVIGENVTEDDIARVYGDFQLERGAVPELIVSSGDEYALFGDSQDASLLGSGIYCCVCLRILPAGSGSTVELHNINRCTEEMYRSALHTAGMEDVALIVSAPFAVSGTAALAGIYKAYEDMSGTALSAEAKALGAKELLLTGELAEQLGSFDASLMVESLKGALEYTASLSDAELKERIREVAAEYSLTLNDTQVEQLMGLCRQMEKLDELKLQEKVEQVKESLQRLQELKEKAGELEEKTRGWREKLKQVGKDVQSTYENVSGWFEKNSGKFQRLWDDLRSLFSDEEEAMV